MLVGVRSTMAAHTPAVQKHYSWADKALAASLDDVARSLDDARLALRDLLPEVVPLLGEDVRSIAMGVGRVQGAASNRHTVAAASVVHLFDAPMRNVDMAIRLLAAKAT